MTDVRFETVEDVIKEAYGLIETYKDSYERHQQYGHIEVANSVRGSIIGVVALLARITDKSAEDYFKEIFPGEWDDKK